MIYPNAFQSWSWGDGLEVFSFVFEITWAAQVPVSDAGASGTVASCSGPQNPKSPRKQLLQYSKVYICFPWVVSPARNKHQLGSDVTFPLSGTVKKQQNRRFRSQPGACTGKGTHSQAHKTPSLLGSEGNRKPISPHSSIRQSRKHI